MMDVQVVMKKLELRQNNTTSTGMNILTGNAQMNVEAVSNMYVKVVYKGEVYEKDINVNVSEYNETQTGSVGGYTYTSSAVNPTQQKSKLLESCLNRSVIEFENFLKGIMQNQ
jgi:CO dehydrogenase/acetyl-CoA synthase beta subunit